MSSPKPNKSSSGRTAQNNNHNSKKKKTNTLFHKIDAAFSWSNYSTACLKILKSLWNNKLCKDFIGEIDLSQFIDYSCFVNDPISLSNIKKLAEVCFFGIFVFHIYSLVSLIQRDENSSRKKINKVSQFIRLTTQVFVNALLYWRKHTDLRLQIYECLRLFKKLLFAAIPGLKKIYGMLFIRALGVYSNLSIYSDLWKAER